MGLLYVESSAAKEIRESLGLTIANAWSEISKEYRQGKHRDSSENLKLFLKKLDVICPIYAEVVEFLKENEPEEDKQEEINDMLPKPGDFDPIEIPKLGVDITTDELLPTGN